MSNTSMLRSVSLAALVLAATCVVHGQAPEPDELARGIAMGTRCEAPLLKLSPSGASFDAYVESPLARIAVVAATAHVMHVPVDAPGVRNAIRPGYRVWFIRRPRAPLDLSISRVRVRWARRVLAPASVDHERLVVGAIPSHGIIEAVRVRFPEYVFDRLPPDGFTIVVMTNHGEERFRVAQRRRVSLLHVCN